MRRKKKNNLPEINLMELIPVRIIGHEIREEDKVTIFAPRFKNTFLLKYLQPRLKHPYLKIKLDEIGSAVWLLCDGEKCVSDIAGILTERFGKKIDPCVERLELFITHLEHSGYIEFSNMDECREKAAGTR